MGRCSRWRTEDGSLPMVMLAAIVLGGVVVASFTYVQVGQQTAREDRDRNQAIQVADAGIQDAFLELADVDPDSTVALGESLTSAGAIGDGGWEWTATRVGQTRWQVRSEGTFRGSLRAIEAMVGPRQTFGLAAFADVLIELRGGNAADSYNGVTQGTGNGSVGSNNQITLRGNATVDWVMRYADANYNGGGTITQTDGIVRVEDEAFLPPIGAEAFADGGICHDQPLIAYTGQFSLIKGKTYCFTQVEFPAGDHRLVPASDSTDPTTPPEPVDPDEPTRIYIAPSGNLELKGQGNNPCTGATCVNMAPYGQPLPSDTHLGNGTAQPVATDLEIYLASGEVLANNHTNIAAGIYAPSSNCSGANAQGHVYGSIVCRTLDSKGGWSFHYDDRFEEVSSEDFAVEGWREEFPGTTSFD